jgi:FkbM family methyltransferase
MNNQNKAKKNMMPIFGMMCGSLCNFSYLMKSGHSLKNKFKILITWIKINLKLFLFAKSFKLKKEIIFGCEINAFDYRAIRSLFEEIFYKNEYFFKAKNEKPIIFDCGANIGFATIFFKWLYPESEIYTFEPDKETFEILKKNILDNNLKNIHLFNAAISNKSGEIKFFFNRRVPGSLIMSTNPERMSQDEAIVDSISLSDFIKNNNINSIDFIKMDIEGSEKESIEDLAINNQLIKIDKLTIEYHHKIGKQKSNLS